ncbi:MAG: NrpR regulatory domain-containing protein [Candidatus Saganbacteria bacterium]|nr:NrpR regulatory domain-containing protein [Candidatus Saganbacteria bacterium]
MIPDTDRKINHILKIIASSQRPIGSVEISTRLKELGINLTERTVRHYLKMLTEKGLVKVFWKEGRVITKKGEEEIKNILVSDKVGMISAHIETMAYSMDFDLEEKAGRLILNLSFFHKSDFPKALKIMREVFAKKLSMGDMVAVAESGQEIGGVTVPKGKVAFGTLCGVNLNGILLKQAIPVGSSFGGVLQIEGGQPLRFTELISYSGSTVDPHEVFIRSKMTSVREAAKGSGKILAGSREIPAGSRQRAKEIIEKMETAGLGRVLFMGEPSSAVLGMPGGLERVGIVIPGGLNPVAAAGEWGIETESKALSCLIDYSELKSFWDL